MQSEQTARCRDFHECPNEQGDPRGWDNESLGEEEPPDLLDGDKHEGELDCPVDEVAHDSCCGALVDFWEDWKFQAPSDPPNVVMFEPSGRWFGTRVRRLGQIAFNI